MKYPKRSQYKHAKSQYRLRNWSEYEAGLQRRGDLTWRTNAFSWVRLPGYPAALTSSNSRTAVKSG